MSCVDSYRIIEVSHSSIRCVFNRTTRNHTIGPVVKFNDLKTNLMYRLISMSTDSEWKVAIIGAGLSGASAGQALAKQGASVALFDKGRGPGGRCATRRHDVYSFDHGAQYFTARDPRFRRQVAAWTKQGVATRWRPRIGELVDGRFEPSRRNDLWVGTPGMNEIAREMLGGLDIRFNAPVRAIERGANGWAVIEDSGKTHIGFDQLLVTVPAPQLGGLLSDHFPEASEAAEHAMMLPCWSLMLAFSSRVDLPFDAAKVSGDGPISWLSRNSSKPGRAGNGMDCWVVQADHDWSREHVEFSPIEATEQLLKDFTRICMACDTAMTGPAHVAAHRWRYALATPNEAKPCMFEPETGLNVAGDWLSGARIETAWLSGLAAAESLAAAHLDQPAAAAGT